MEFQQINILESKITQALELIKRLRTENEVLQEKVGYLESQLMIREQEIENLKKQIEQQNHSDIDQNQFKRREAEIRSRVESMLAKLEALEVPL